MNPKISIVVPCYNYARFLPDCIGSILAQKFGDYEVLILDDCSADETPDAARSFKDGRIKYIRNEQNLGAARNFNKGIEMSQSKSYVTVISADDRYGQPNALERFVDFMDAHPKVGYAFCDVKDFETGKPPEPSSRYYRNSVDQVIPGRDWVRKMTISSHVPYAVHRRECFEKCGLFPSDCGYFCDWFLFCTHALHFDVGYLAETLFHCRVHEKGLSQGLSCSPEIMRNVLAVRLRLREEALQVGAADLAREFEHEIILDAARQEAWKLGGEMSALAIEKVAQGLKTDAGADGLPPEFQGRVKTEVRVALEECAEISYKRGDSAGALRYYELCLSEGGWNRRVATKAALLRLGKPGFWLRRLLSNRRHAVPG